MKVSDSANAFSHFTNEELLTVLSNLTSMNQMDIASLKQEFMNREMFEESFAIDTFFSDQFDPSTLSLKEIQALVSERLHAGESIESIKLDLADHGVTLGSLVNKEGKRMHAIFDKIESASETGISEARIYEDVKNTYNYTDEEITAVKKNVKGRSLLYTIGGICLALLSLFKFLVHLFGH